MLKHLFLNEGWALRANSYQVVSVLRANHLHEWVGRRFHKDYLFGNCYNVRLAQNTGIKVFAEKDSVAFQLQTGNISRAPYDRLKLQYLYVNARIIAAALARPTHDDTKKWAKILLMHEELLTNLNFLIK